MHYRQLNERTVKDLYPLPYIDVCLEALAEATWFSTFDLRRGTFRFKVMPFGLCNAPATFRRLMNVATAGLNPEICLVYLDDINVYSCDLGSHLERLERLFERLSRAGLKLKVSKCKLLQREVAFIGHRVNAEGLSTDPEKVEAI